MRVRPFFPLGGGRSACQIGVFRALLRALVLVLAWGGTGWPAQAMDNGEDRILLGLYAGSRREWTRTEVRATFDLWAQELTAKFQIPVTFIHYDDPARMRQDFLDGRIHGINTGALRIVRDYRPEELAEGYATLMKGGWNLMLFAGRSVPARGPADLAGKRLVMLEEDSLGEVYLETLCLRHHRQPCRDILANIQRVTTNNQALMRVFFGKADLALVHGYGYTVAVEMNPQLDKSLRKLAEYPIRSQHLAFYSARVDKGVRDSTLRVVPTLHTYPRGRQLLDIFKIDRLEKATTADLQSVLELERERLRLLSQVSAEARVP